MTKNLLVPFICVALFRCGGLESIEGDAAAEDSIVEDFLVPDYADSVDDSTDTIELDLLDADDGSVEEDACSVFCPSWRDCGDDGCEGSCGTCPDGQGCSRVGVCVPEGCESTLTVPAGNFVMGSDEGEGFWDERPEHIVQVSSYRIDACEVTNRQWKACVEDGACTEPQDIASHTRPGYYIDELFTHHPVVNVKWAQAVEYCVWTGGRLPTEAEWEKATRGGCELTGDPTVCEDPGDERRYSWGDDAPTCDYLNHQYSTTLCIGDTSRVGSYPLGVSPYGALDMLGNVEEWVSDYYSATYYWDGGPPWIDPTGPGVTEDRLSRGGNWAFGTMYCNNSYREPRGYESSGPMIGFRCVY